MFTFWTDADEQHQPNSIDRIRDMAAVGWRFINRDNRGGLPAAFLRTFSDGNGSETVMSHTVQFQSRISKAADKMEREMNAINPFYILCFASIAAHISQDSHCEFRTVHTAVDRRPMPHPAPANVS